MKEYLSSCEEVLKEQNSSEQGLSTGKREKDFSFKEIFRGTCRPDDHYPDRGCGNFRNHSFL